METINFFFAKIPYKSEEKKIFRFFDFSILRKKNIFAYFDIA